MASPTIRHPVLNQAVLQKGAAGSSDGSDLHEAGEVVYRRIETTEGGGPIEIIIG